MMKYGENNITKSASALLLGALSVASPVFADCTAGTVVAEAAPEEIKSFFANKDKSVVTFVGYSGADYEDKPAMLEAAATALENLDPATTIVNIGATPDGIGAVYRLARDKGFITTGIVSTQAREYDVALSSCVDYVFYVKDKTWGGYLDGEDKQLSPTSTAMVENSDVMIGIGGGEVARDELSAAKELGKAVSYIPAEMNHQKALEKAKKKGRPNPTQEELKGAANGVFAAGRI